jgi:hypothetical protein
MSALKLIFSRQFWRRTLAAGRYSMMRSISSPASKASCQLASLKNLADWPQRMLSKALRLLGPILAAEAVAIQSPSEAPKLNDHRNM